ncbi:hypothetical protein MBLNU459_g5687t2 [Dothideomycetes sp. NU459]
MFLSSRKDSRRNSFYHSRVTKSTSKKQPSFKGQNTSQRYEKISQTNPQTTPETSPHLNSAIVTLSVGPSQRLFAAHEDVLCHSPFFAEICKRQYFTSSSKRIDVVDEEPEIFSSVLEYLYKGDYYPKLEYDRKRGTWLLEDGGSGNTAAENTLFHNAAGRVVLKDTAVYCAAERYGIPELKRLALKKQGLQSGVQCSTILSSARFAYARTPDSDSRLRAHYLALIIRSRNTFKRSGTMQMEMEAGGKMFFDLFVAMVNHLDDVSSLKSPR